MSILTALDITTPRRLLAALALMVGACDRSSPPTPEPADPAPDAATAVQSTPAPAIPAEPTGPPRLAFGSLVHDFGSFPEIERRTARFRFANIGGADLVISELKPTCGCTAVTLEQTRYAPGEQGSIEVVFTPTAPGTQKKYIKVISNDPAGVQDLVVQAAVEPFLTISPRELRFDALPVGEEHRLGLRITAADPQLSIESLRTTNPFVSVRLLPAGAERTADRFDREVQAVIAPGAPWGPVFAWIEIAARGRPAPDAPPVSHAVRIRLQGRLFGSLRAEPDTLRVGTLPSETVQREIRLERGDGQPFTAMVIDVRAEGLIDPVVQVQPAGRAACRLVLAATAAAAPGPIDGEVHLSTNVPGEESIVIRISGIVRQPPPGHQP